LMVREYVPVLVAPVVSWTVSWMLLYVPTVVGVPVKVTSDPVTTALRPGGLLLNGDHLIRDPVETPVLADLDRALADALGRR